MSTIALLEDLQELYDQKTFKSNELIWLDSQIKNLKTKIYKVCEHVWEIDHKCTICNQYKQ